MKLVHLGLLFVALLFPTLALSDVHEIPIGVMGLPVGTFAVIEGTYHAMVTTDGLWRNFSVETVNGKKVEAPVDIGLINCTDKMTVGKHYVLHGYESAMWLGAPPLPPDESELLYPDWRKEPRHPFALRSNFWVTSIEKENGITVPDARPVDPSFKLDEPQFGQPPVKPPMGILGFPLGTYMVITVGAPRVPTKDIVCEVLAINGKPVDHRITIIVPFFEVPSGKQQVVLHGFESADWRGAISWPASETKVKYMPVVYSGPWPPNAPPHFDYCDSFTVTNWTTRAFPNPDEH